MPKIMLVKETVTYGGASKVLLWLGDKLHENGYDVTITSIHPITDTVPRTKTKIIDLGISFERNIFKRNTVSLFNKILIIYKLQKVEKFDIILNFSDYSIYILFLIKKFFKFKLIVSERIDPYSTRSISDKIRRSLYKFTDFVVFQTIDAQKFFPNLKAKSAVIFNPVVNIYSKPTWNLHTSEFLIINVARFDIIQKRQDLLLEAFSIVLKKLPQCKLLLVGSGPDESKVKNLIEQKKMESSVTVLHSTKVMELLPRARLFVFSSDFEGIPNAVIEAMQVGVPVVSVDTSPGCIKLLLDNGLVGAIVSRNDPNALADKIIETITNETKLEQYSTSGFLSLTRFNEQTIAQKWIDVLDKFH